MIANLPVSQILIYGVQAQPKPSYRNTEHSAPQLVKPNGYTLDVTRNGRCMENDNYKVPGSFADGDNEEDDEDDDEYEDAAEDGAVISPDGEEKDEYEVSSKSSGRSSSIALSGQRTVSMRNLPDRVTHEDVTDAVRGGALLHVYLRPRDHFADVSFVDESAAHDFLQYSRTYGLYVAGKRVSCCNLVYET